MKQPNMYNCNTKSNTLHIKEPSKELLEFARTLRANNQEKIIRKRTSAMLKSTEHTYRYDYEVFYKDGSSELREESVVAEDSYQAYLKAEKLLERKEKGKTYNILDLRKLW